MLLYLHHTAGDVIALAPRTYLWHYAETPRGGTDTSIMGFVVEPIRGSYTEVDGKRYYLYWTVDRILKFVTPNNKQFALFRHLTGALFEDLRDGLQLDLVPAQKNDGSLVPGYSTMFLRDEDGGLLHTITYNSNYYLQLYLADITPFTDRNLASWDFFISLKNGIEKMSGMCISADKIANSQKIKSRWNDRFPQRDKLSQKPRRSPQTRMSK
ncbi:hypothetical protein Hrubri_3333 [Herbaspirillum rubrisubalbicans M1]|uniref:hypothetical protein n=1 Tax=Herbaspirillum rubrisubalbicans TaxID=80842 RepID=UPI00073A23E5|nr:hypothetical protein [Herbaspirillum rubrisubalbicans]ALU90493.1 hypothetical protein Hrubri_3333 [Herbaspirillum rubrisubalbicans M1]